jgi:CheY-like chemotaxis protein
LTQEALSEGKIFVKLSVVEDGVEALRFLRRDDPYVDVPRPDVILLDLNLPRMDGRELLSHIKNDIQLLTIPVVVLTTSRAHEDIERSYNLHANCYITKPVDLRKFLDVVQLIESFWLTIVTLPTRYEN